MKKLLFYVVFVLFILPIGVNSMLFASAVTAVTAEYIVDGNVNSNSGETVTDIGYYRAASGNNPGISSSEGYAKSISNNNGLKAFSSYKNGIGMNYEHYISSSEADNLRRPLDEAINFKSTAIWKETFIASESGTYSWTTIIPGAQIHMYYDTFRGYLPTSYSLTAGFEGMVKANNMEIFNYGVESSFTSGGGSTSHHWGIGGAPSTYSHAGDPTFLDITGYWNTGPYSFTVNLGQFNADDLITIEMMLDTYIYGTGEQNGAEVFVGDVNNLSAMGVTGYLTPTSQPYENPTVPVPEPATIFLLSIGGIILLGKKMILGIRL